MTKGHPAHNADDNLKIEDDRILRVDNRLNNTDDRFNNEDDTMLCTDDRLIFWNSKTHLQWRRQNNLHRR